ncbi:MAG TPA: hypothetical protein VNO81_05675 [Candidatus Nitrosotenuis sp.]|nr:hypothetical protein [Candidatus Nitrosotenuis sp.]
MLRVPLAAAAAALLLGLLCSAPGQAQLLLVDSDYRITNLDPSGERFGIALVDDDPRVQQNWVYLKIETKIYRRMTASDGSQKIIPVTIDKFWKIVRVGEVLRVQGGRDWDGSIHADTLWLN